MKKLFFMGLTLAISVCSMAQGIVLTFTGVDGNSAYVRMDSVKVFRYAVQPGNRWTEVIASPDTVLSFGGGAGIDAAKGTVPQISACPNPSNGHTFVSVEMDQSRVADVYLYNVSGGVAAHGRYDLAQGSNLLDVRLGREGLYLFTVVAANGSKTLKLLSTGGAENSAIVLAGRGTPVAKRASTHTFRAGDSVIVTGFATVDGKKLTSHVVRQKVNASRTFQLRFVSPIQGMLSGAFSVSDSTQVRFSQGNLQWKSTGTHAVAGGGTAAGTWRFAPNQYDTIGSDNINASSTYSGWMSLFGWGTSGYNNCHPYLRSSLYIDYADGVSVLSGTLYDWGAYNAISNGGNQPGLWRTLTADEWEYMLNNRADAINKKGYATVEGTGGWVFLPDSWTLPSGLQFTRGMSAANAYTSAQWSEMEAAGAIFLPYEGLYVNNYVYPATSGHYWSANRINNIDIRCLYFNHMAADPYMSSNQVVSGLSVRLVQTY